MRMIVRIRQGWCGRRDGKGIVIGGRLIIASVLSGFAFACKVQREHALGEGLRVLDLNLGKNECNFSITPFLCSLVVFFYSFL